MCVRLCETLFKTKLRAFLTVIIGSLSFIGSLFLAGLLALWWYTPSAVVKLVQEKPKGTHVVPIAGTDNPGRQGDIVFIHGLGGNAIETWTNLETGHSWPATLGSERPNLGIWSVDYDAASSEWQGSAMPIQDRAKNVLKALEAKGIGDRPVIFVGHSLGGLIVKQMLNTAVTLKEEPHLRILDHTRGVVFVATPHVGADAATVLKMLQTKWPELRGTELLDQLKKNDPTLRLLNEWYITGIDPDRIKTQALYEQVAFPGVGMIVEESSAMITIPGSPTSVGIDGDHLTICKPKDSGELICDTLKLFIDANLRPEGKKSDLTIEKYLERFKPVRRTNQLAALKEEFKRTRFTWEAYVTMISTDEKDRWYRIAPAMKANIEEGVHATCYKSDFQDIPVGARVRITGLFNSRHTSSGTTFLEDAKILEVLSLPDEKQGGADTTPPVASP